jgi:hypothetical protein
VRVLDPVARLQLDRVVPLAARTAHLRHLFFDQCAHVHVERACDQAAVFAARDVEQVVDHAQHVGGRALHDGQRLGGLGMLALHHVGRCHDHVQRTLEVVNDEARQLAAQVAPADQLVALGRDQRVAAAQ